MPRVLSHSQISPICVTLDHESIAFQTLINHEEQANMRVAEVLSDFTSLRPDVCDTEAALALVSVSTDNSSRSRDDTSNKDADLQRVQDLLQLHAKAKAAHSSGIDQDLEQARAVVAKVLQNLR
ncbi:hypothetical protein MRB53_041412 [Persea americana]|nr:hypothetical protein MRB53_041412 [Persea americana]